MPAIAFLLGDIAAARHDNHHRLPRAFAAAGWQVSCFDQEAVRLDPTGVRLGGVDPLGFDLIWPLGMGRQDTFLDRMQLLHQLPRQRLVIPADALTYWHAKYAWWPYMPETHASADPAYLKGVLNGGGDWVVKPSAGSFGRDVSRIAPGTEGERIIDHLTAHGTRFCLLQRYAVEIESGEKRTLVAAGQIIGTYLRRSGPDLRTNLAAGGSPHPAELSADERDLVRTLADDLASRGVGFAAVDTAYPWLMEVNLANPGGLATLEALYGRDPTPAVVAALTEWRGR